MPFHGHVLVGDQDPAKAKYQLLGLKHAGFDGLHVSDVEALERLAETRKPDVILLGQFDGTAATGVARRLREKDETARIPVVLFDADVSGKTGELAIAAGIADIFSTGEPMEILLARLPRIVRFSRLVHEIERRAATAAGMNRQVDMSHIGEFDHADACKVLTLAESSEYEAGVYAGLMREGFDAILEQDPYRATDLVDRNDFDAVAVVVNDRDDREKISYFCTHVRSNTHLNGLPILVIDRDSEAGDFYKAGASVVLPNDGNVGRAGVYLNMLVNRRRFQSSLAHPMSTVLGPETADAKVPRAFSRRFFDLHLRRSVEAAVLRPANVSVGIFSVPTIGRVRDTLGADNASLLQDRIVDWIVDLVRTVDTVAVLGESLFGVILCDASEREGYRIANRIAGILQNSEYALGEEVMEAIHVIVECGVAELQPGEDAAGLVKRASENLA